MTSEAQREEQWRGAQRAHRDRAGGCPTCLEDWPCKVWLDAEVTRLEAENADWKSDYDALYMAICNAHCEDGCVSQALCDLAVTAVAISPREIITGPE